MNDSRQTVIDMIFGRWRSQILYTGVKLGIFDALSVGPKTSTDLAVELRLNLALIYRLLRALGSLGLLKEETDQTFSLTPAAELLRKDHPESLRGMTLLEEGPEHYAVWKHLPAMIQDGRQDGFVREFGHPIFVHAIEDSAYGAVFDEAMSSLSSGETAMVLEALATHDFSGISHLCDVGGGHGHLLCSLLTKHPDLRGTAYELPNVIERKDLLWASKMNVADRCEYVAGDMFKEVPGADAYILKHILHDWNDAECVQILSNMHKASPRNARAFVAEFVIPGPETPHFSKLFDIHMLCATSGQERTEAEYAALFEKAGWKYVKTWLPDARLMGVVEARKA
ncbi:MAG: methyltransferase [Candidatus Tectomicrobia bacterium]